jgi:hypothetical protein
MQRLLLVGVLMLGGCVTAMPTPESINAHQAAMESHCVAKGYKRGTKDFQTCVSIADTQATLTGSPDGGMSGTAQTLLWYVPLAVGAATLSDERAKRDIVRIGSWKGLGVYRFRYLWDEAVHTGLMAQEVQGAFPAAVFTGGDGYLRIDYSKL